MAIHDGGLAATPRDLARFGLMLLDGGVVPDRAADTPRAVIPARWLRDGWGVDSDIRSAFAESPTELAYPGGWYRNQFWFRPGPNGDVLLCRGIHGQLVYVSRRTRTVCVKLSHWPQPVAIEHAGHASDVRRDRRHAGERRPRSRRSRRPGCARHCGRDPAGWTIDPTPRRHLMSITVVLDPMRGRPE